MCAKTLTAVSGLATDSMDILLRKIDPLEYAIKRAEFIAALCTKKRGEMKTWGDYTISTTLPSSSMTF